MASDPNFHVPNFQRYSSIPGMLIFGTSTVVIGKLLFEMSAKGRNGKVHLYKKPWIQVEGMFVGMMLCLVVFEITRLVRRARTGKENVAIVSHKRVYFLVIAPAMFDLIATALMNIGLLWIPASIWQMLRGSMVIFSSIMSVFFLKRKLYPYHWSGVVTVLVALILVGWSCIENDSSGGGQKYDKTREVVGIFLVVGAQVIQSIQIIVEDYLLHNVEVDPTLIVGLEGFWGTIVTTAICLPIVGALPGKDGDGIHEDTIDSLIMMGNDGAILGGTIAYIFAILFYNMFGMFVTRTFTAVHRTILEAVRTSCIWVTELIIHYGIDKSKGESWSGWSWLELGGFIILMVGLFVYNGILRFPFFYYPPKEGDQSTRNLLEVSSDALDDEI